MNDMKKMKPAWIVGIFLLSIFTFYQCTNNEELFTPGSGIADFANLQEVHDSLTQNDTVALQILNPDIENELEGPQGIRLVFPANSCTNPSGDDPVAPFKVQLIEIFKRGDMIRHNTQTFATEDALVSGGMFWVKVTDANGAELELNGVQAILPRQTDAAGYEEDMEYFTGVDQTTPSGPVLSWGAGESDLTFDEDAGTNGEYTIWSILGGWSNCDAFYELLDEDATQFSVRVTNALDYTNTQVFFALNDFSTVAALTTVDVDALTTYQTSIPMGAAGKLIAISLIDGQLYFASQDVTIAGDDMFEMEVQPGTLDELNTLLSTLN
jgi:hypothetical protein